MLAGKVDVSEMMGSEIHLHVNVLGKDAIIIVQTMDLHESGNKLDCTIGSPLSFTFSGSMIHLFGKDGKNLEA